MERKITGDVYYCGVNDHAIDLFEGQYKVPHGMAYNSYLIIDKKIALFDTVDIHYTHEWLDNIQNIIGKRKIDYLIIQHMEPDHSGNIINFLNAYPETIIVSNSKAFKMMENFFNNDIDNKKEVKDGEVLSLGKHELKFLFAPMVHWPEVMMTYDNFDKVLFSADGFGKFGALDTNEEWACEARRYYFGIVGKYGQQVQNVLNNIRTNKIDIKTICPLHGPILKENIAIYLNYYNIWSSYQVESEGIAIFYTSVYGHTKQAAFLLAENLKKYGAPKVVISDLARTDMAEDVEDAFKYGKIVLATTTYNGSIFPYMNTFITHLVERNYQNRTIGFIENGSWAPVAAKTMKEKLSGLKNINFIEPVCHILSSLSPKNEDEIEDIAIELTKDYQSLNEKKTNKQDLTTLSNIAYGLYVVTSKYGHKDNGLIVNTVSQLNTSPLKIGVSIAKENFSHHIIKNNGKMNINFLTEKTPFDLFKNFGFQSGRNIDKFQNYETKRSDNGLLYLTNYINAFISLKVEDYVNLGSHGLFICSISESQIISNEKSMTYAYYQEHVKPKPNNNNKNGYICSVCGYVFDGDELPNDFLCPLCKHGVTFFEKIKNNE